MRKQLTWSWLLFQTKWILDKTLKNWTCVTQPSLMWAIDLIYKREREIVFDSIKRLLAYFETWIGQNTDIF